MELKKIAVIGLAKSGTTALYSAVKSGVPAPRRMLFEPNNGKELQFIVNQSEENALTKMIFSKKVASFYDPKLFSHNVAIIRDPRDMLVSSALFRFNRMKLINDENRRTQLIKLFEQKEQAPKSLAFRDILTAAEGGDPNDFATKFQAKLTRYIDYLRLGTHFIVRYDDFVSNDLASLNSYLGFEVIKPDGLQGWVSKINRKGAPGDWKNWLTDSDVEYFKPYLQSYLDGCGMDGDWSTNDYPVISPEHCSKYIAQLMQSRQSDPNLQSAQKVELEALLSAAEDNKANALKHLVKYYEDETLGNDLQKSARHAFRLGQLGYSNSAIDAGKKFLAIGERNQAIKSFELALQQKHRPAYFFLGRTLTRAKKKPRVYARGVALLQKGADLGSRSCQRRLDRLSANTIA